MSRVLVMFGASIYCSCTDDVVHKTYDGVPPLADEGRLVV